MEIVIKNQAIERDLATIVNWYYTKYPESAASFDSYVSEESSRLIKPTAMTTDGHMLNFAKLPAPLYSIIKRAFSMVHGIDDFFRDQSNYYLLCKVWQTARIKRIPTKLLTV